MYDSEKITIGICSPGHVSTNFMTSILDIARSQRQLGQFISLQGSGVISRLRNQICSTFLDKTKDDWLLMIDTDEMLTIEGFQKLVKTADRKTVPILSGVVHGAWEVEGAIYPEPVPCIFRTNEDGGLYSVHDYPEDEVIEIDAAGTGCLLVHRSVIEKFRAESDPVHQQGKWGFFQDMPLHGQWVGEDLLFSLRAKGFGFKIFAHTGVQLAHERRYWLSKDHHTDFRRFNLPRHHSPEKEITDGRHE
jgi:hypothetical protein